MSKTSTSEVPWKYVVSPPMKIYPCTTARDRLMALIKTSSHTTLQHSQGKADPQSFVKKEINNTSLEYILDGLKVLK